MLRAAILQDRAVLVLMGPDTRTLLQGLVTNDMAQCAPGKALYAALLTPQGKILFEFFIAQETEERFLIDCAAARAADLAKRLGLYKLRAKVAIAPAPDLAVAAVWNGDGAQTHEGAVAFADPRLPLLGQRLIAPRAELETRAAKMESGDYHAHLLSHGVPDSADIPPDSVFALDAGLEELNGVNFKKGCYVGQEVTSRMKHRATARRRFLIAGIAGELPPPETPLEAEGREIGILANGTGGHALALVRLDRVAEAEQSGAAITAAGRPVTLHRPGWFHG